MSRSHSRSTTLAAIVAVLVLSMAGVWTPAAYAKTRWSQRVELQGLAAQAANNSLKYLHTTWWNTTYAYHSVVVTKTVDTEATETIEVANPTAGFSAGEGPVRSQASALYATSLALRSKTYSAKAVGVGVGEANRRVIAWSNSLALSYERDHWGGGWQSPLWVYYMAFGSRQVWGSLPVSTRARIGSAVAAEANGLLQWPPPYYRNPWGTVINHDDSKSEENAWDGLLLLLAARQFPDNPHASQWEDWGQWYCKTSYVTPNQVGSDPQIGGSNLNADGTVTNGGRPVNPDYMMTQAEFTAKSVLLSLQTKTPVCRGVFNNQALIWWALTKKKFPTPRYLAPGGTIYRTGAKGVVTANIYYPNGTGRSKVRKFNAAEMDVEVFASKFDKKSYDWAKAHLLALLKQQRRHVDGKIFSNGETKFPEDEQFAACSEVEMAWRLGLMR